MLVIKNGKDTQTLQFGYSCLKRLSEVWGTPGIQATVSKVFSVVAVFVNDDGSAKEVNDVPFEVIDVLIDIIKAASKEEDFTGEDYGDWIFKNMPSMFEIFSEFVTSMPMPEEEKKQLALSMKKAKSKK